MKILKSHIKHFSLVLTLSLFFINFHTILRSNPKFITRSKKYHIVKKNETLYSISKKYDIEIHKIKLYNNIKGDRIFVGQKIYFKPKVGHKRSFVAKKDMPESKVYTVKKGDTLYRISKMFGVEVVDLIEYNNLKSFQIKVNDKINLVPQKTKMTDQPAKIVKKKTTQKQKEKQVKKTSTKKNKYEVKKGDTLFRIAKNHHMSVANLKKINNLNSNNLSIGQILNVNPEAEHVINSRYKKEKLKVSKKSKIYTPYKGKIISKFGLRHGKPHRGIDIKGKLGEPIYAALDGKAVFVGRQSGYGNVIILEHSNYVMTVYAHNESNLIRLGDSVKKGQPIATIGQTGNAVGPHVHFEYRKHGKAIDPLEVME